MPRACFPMVLYLFIFKGFSFQFLEKLTLVCLGCWRSMPIGGVLALLPFPQGSQDLLPGCCASCPPHSGPMQP